MSWPSIASALRRQISSFRGFGDRAIVPPGGYLFMFQMSVASCHCPPIFRHTTTYLPVICSGGCAFVLKLNVPISRAAPGPSDWTSTVVSLASPSCFTAPPQNFSIALCPFAISAPAGSTYASGVYIPAKAFASPLLKAAIHSAFSLSIELLACAHAGEADNRKQATKIAMRAIGTLPGRGGLSRDFAQCAILKYRSCLPGREAHDRRSSRGLPAARRTARRRGATAGALRDASCRGGQPNRG